MPCNNFVKNITSKDNELSQNTLQTLIKSQNIDLFRGLCEKSDFIFPFLKEKIINNFVKLINKEDLKNTFEFSKIHNFDFEDLIINSWLKFKDPELDNKILELFKSGTDEQKTYCVKYFMLNKKSEVLNLIIENSKTNFSPLKINCAKALKEYNDITVLNNMKNIVQNSSDDFEIVEAYEFISAYGGEEQIKFIVQNSSNSPFLTTIISNLLNFNDFNLITKSLNKENIIKIFSVLIEGYPEDISLDTIQYYQIYEYIELLNNFKTPYSNNVLLLAKIKFSEFLNDDIYTFDLDKNLKTELKEIVNLLNNLNLNFNNISNELNSFSKSVSEYMTALSVVELYDLKEYAKQITDLINDYLEDENLIAKSAQVLKNLGAIENIDKDMVKNLNNQNIKEFITSLF